MWAVCVQAAPMTTCLPRVVDSRDDEACQPVGFQEFRQHDLHLAVVIVTLLLEL